MISYEKLLEKNGITNVDFINDNGYFYRKFKKIDEYRTVGYKGYITYDSTGVHILYSKLQYLDYESYLNDTLAYNAEHTRKLIGINIDGDNFNCDLAINDERDPKDIYREYKTDILLFNKKQDVLKNIYETEMTMSNLSKKLDEYYRSIYSINKELNGDLNEKCKSR